MPCVAMTTIFNHNSNTNVDTTKTTNHISLCSGYGGIDLGLHACIPSMRTVAYAEIEAFACELLLARMEGGQLDAAPIWTDLKSFPWADFSGKVDILSGGYPCQPFSAAGKRAGADDPRHLWPFIAGGIRLMRPKICFFENVEGHITLGLSSVISDLEELGYKVSWGVFSAAECGAPHQRKRIFILAYDHRERVEELGRQIAVGSQQYSAWDDGDNAWPSRPGKPQHAWEPPRVVANNHSPHAGHGEQRPERTRWDLSGGCGEGRGKLGDSTHQRDFHQTQQDNTEAGVDFDRAGEGERVAHTHGGRGEEPEHQQANLPTEPSGGNGEAMGNTEQLLFPTTREHGTMDEASGIPAGERGEPSQTDPIAGATRKREGDGGNASEFSETQPTLGRDSHGSASGMGYAELCVTCDNRTDELRLLGNGVVPATAREAFATLFAELLL